jgi:hypothetical protein
MSQQRPKFVTIMFWDFSLEETFPGEGFSICISKCVQVFSERQRLLWNIAHVENE